MSTELPQLSDADRADAARIRAEQGPSAFQWEIDQAIARHFLAAGLERAAKYHDAFAERHAESMRALSWHEIQDCVEALLALNK